MRREFFFPRLILFLFILHHPLCAQTNGISPPKRELRAVWLTTLQGSDWPKSTDPDQQQKSLLSIIRTIASFRLNTIFFQVRSRGNAIYPSAIEPWAAEMTGTLGKDPGWDPLALAVDETHRNGLELHAWINIGKVYNGDGSAVNHPRHLLRSHPEWVKKSGKEWWLDIGLPEVRRYLISLVMELVRNYDLDGIHLDYLRYPSTSFDDEGAFRKFGRGMTLDDWRRNNINSFVRDLSSSIKKEKPWMKIGSAPIGLYKPIKGAAAGFFGFSEAYQDAPLWLKENYHDYAIPQMYWDIGTERAERHPDFAAVCIDWSSRSSGRLVAAGIGLYRESVMSEILTQIDFSRQAGLQGQSFFRYENLLAAENRMTTYRFPALVPSMPWKDRIPPLCPANIQVVPSFADLPQIRWEQAAPASDGERTYRYVVYRASSAPVNIENPRNILAVIPGSADNFVDETPRRDKIDYFYTVTALDRAGNESKSGESSILPASAVQKMAGALFPASLGQNYPDPFSVRTYIPYEIGEKEEVRLSVIDSNTGIEIILADGITEPGIYIAVVDSSQLTLGRHSCRLRTSSGIVTKTMERKREAQ